MSLSVFAFHLRSMARPFIAMLMLALLIFFAPACERREAQPQTARIFQLGDPSDPFRATITIDRTTLTTAEQVRLTLDITIPPEHMLDAVDLAAALPEGFSSTQPDQDQSRQLESGAMQRTRTYLITPFLEGTYTIAAFQLRASRLTQGAAPTGAPTPAALTLTTEPIELTIISVLQPGQEDLAEAKGIVEPPPLPRWIWYAIAAAGLLIIAIITFFIIRAIRIRRNRPPEPIFMAAHTLALQRLDALMARKLVSAGRFKEFYESASFILRQYIEDRFGLHAPERTTEEFLEEARAGAALESEDVGLLKSFLAHCDMVKFAAVVPSEREAEQVAATVRAFIDRTHKPDIVVQIHPETTEHTRLPTEVTA